MLLKKVVALVCVVSCVGVLSSCGGGVECTQNREDGVLVNFYDKSTGNPLCGITGTLTDVDNMYVEEFDVAAGSECIGSSYRGAQERSGPYQLVVSKEGYEVYTSNLIEVTRDSCHVITERVDVYLKEL